MTRRFPESAPNIAALATAIADPTRVMICASLLDGRAWTLTELSRALSTPMSSLSEHASLLIDHGVLAERREGRHRYVQIASTDIADDFGIDIEPPRSSTRPYVRRCLDWTERRSHLGGVLGDELCREFLDREWIVRRPKSRALKITPTGRTHLDWVLTTQEDHL